MEFCLNFCGDTSVIGSSETLWKELAYALKEMLHLWCQAEKKHQQLTQKETSAKAVFPSPKWGSVGQAKAKSWSLKFAFFKISPFCFLHSCPFEYLPTSDDHYFPLVKAGKNCMSCSLDYILGFPVGTCLPLKVDLKRHGFDPWVGKIPWRRAWRPTPGFLPGESQGQRNLSGYSPQGRKEVIF